jgi:7,8-dihydro-6-hydroxymethylpterin dimethyltransferase
MNAVPRKLEANRAYVYLGTTQSLCPSCHQVVPAAIIARGQRIYFRKRCPEHGLREDFICSDRNWFDRYDFALPARLPKQTYVEPKRGCPLDCGLCSDHEQHTCVAVIEITDGCNLTCPMCYANSAPGKSHRSYEDVCKAIDRIVAAEGRADVVQLSGGEPTLHPQFFDILDYAVSQPIDYVMINTNGLRIATDKAFIDRLATYGNRVEVYLQFDGFRPEISTQLRGANILDKKLQAIEHIGAVGLNVTLVTTLQAGVNDDQYGQLIDFAATRPFITGLSLQPATYSGRYYLPEEIERRITFPDVIRGLCDQTNQDFMESDFFPLPCAHPNCHILSLAFRHEGKLVPLTRFIDARSNLDLLANGLSFTRSRTENLARQIMNRQASCCGPEGCGPASECATASKSGLPIIDQPTTTSTPTFDDFMMKALTQQLGAKDVLRITITSFLDVYNFDVRRVMKCCTHHVLPSGHIIPFCAYNVLYRDSKVSLPELKPS